MTCDSLENIKGRLNLPQLCHLPGHSGCSVCKACQWELHLSLLNTRAMQYGVRRKTTENIMN